MTRPTPKALLLATSSVIVCGSNAATVTILEEPEPYTPFRIEVRDGGRISRPNHLYLDVANNIISIGLGRETFFLAPTFTVEIEIQGLPPGAYQFNIVDIPSVDGFGGDVEELEGELIIPDAPPTTPAYGFFNDSKEHYFVTAGFDEAQLIESQGWFTIDPGFNVWPAEGPAPDAALEVCRFYSFEVNSHFYTADEEECLSLRQSQSSWEFEGIAFRAIVPSAGACPAGLDPVWRLYNDRAAELDTNHRFVASGETYRSMIADGWIGEGVAFCSPRASD